MAQQDIKLVLNSTGNSSFSSILLRSYLIPPCWMCRYSINGCLHTELTTSDLETAVHMTKHCLLAIFIIGLNCFYIVPSPPTLVEETPTWWHSALPSVLSHLTVGCPNSCRDKGVECSVRAKYPSKQRFFQGHTSSEGL